jgi:ABC-2 type transport system permease protein
VPRSEIIVAKLVVAWAVTTAVTAIPLAVSGLIAESATLAVGLGLGAAVGALAYTALFLALSLVSRRPVAVGLVYIMLWENLLTQFVSGSRVLSVQQYAASLADGIATSEMIKSTVPALAASILAAVFIVGGTVLATNRLRSFSLAGETT